MFLVICGKDDKTIILMTLILLMTTYFFLLMYRVFQSSKPKKSGKDHLKKILHHCKKFIVKFLLNISRIFEININDTHEDY